MSSSYYDWDGNPVSMTEWARIHSARIRVAQDTNVAGSADVSTVYLGINHRFGDGPPLIFETMVFGGPLDQEQERYSTEAQARAGHAKWVEAVKFAANHIEEMARREDVRNALALIDSLGYDDEKLALLRSAVKAAAEVSA